MTEHALADLLAADLSGLNLVEVMIDGLHFAGHLWVVALGIDIDGVKHPLALVEGSTVNIILVRGFAGRAKELGPVCHHPDSGRAGRRQGLVRGRQGGVGPAGNRPLPNPQAAQRCRPPVPPKLRGPVTTKMRTAYHADSALEAEALLAALAKELDKTHSGAAGSLREGMAQTLIVLRLDLPPTLARTFRSTNASSR